MPPLALDAGGRREVEAARRAMRETALRCLTAQNRRDVLLTVLALEAKYGGKRGTGRWA